VGQYSPDFDGLTVATTALVNQNKLSALDAEIRMLRSSLEQNTLTLDDRTSRYSVQFLPSKFFILGHSLAKSAQKVSEVLKELNASLIREKFISETSKVEKAALEEGMKRLESRVNSLEARGQARGQILH
jgi:hypothetical protein